MIRAGLVFLVLVAPAMAAGPDYTALRGEFLSNGEAVHGLLRGEGKGEGLVEVQLSGLAACTGSYRETNGAGEGTIACSDNRKGEFSFVRDGAGGIGCGVLQPGTGVFRFVLGETAFLPGYPEGLSCGR